MLHWRVESAYVKYPNSWLFTLQRKLEKFAL